MTQGKQDITAIARKQRHLSLLRKVKENQTLIAAELGELQGYESQPPSTKENRKSQIANHKSQRSPLTEAESQRLGYEYKDLAEADAASGIRPNLSKYFSRHPRLRKAYDRGRLLRYLVELAPKALIYDSARRMKDLGFSQFESAQNLRDFLDGDAEARELWETARVNAWIKNRESLEKKAGEGDVAAIKLMERWAQDRQRETGEPGAANFSRVGVNQTAELLHVTRETIHEWRTEKGLPVNIDGTFDLYRAIPWWGDFKLKQAVRGRDAVSPLNPFQAVKTERERLQLEKDRGELIEREAVIAFQVVMMQNVVNAFHGAADLANRVFGQPREEIVARLEEFGDEVMAKFQHVPAELKLSDRALTKLTELYEAIKPQRDADKLATEDTEITEK
ncbi:MAG TPA: hypothetical protein VMZ06_12985 [Candidatus Bathyarchaeia archaeon]|nr:hypothetical protein [Candidatus Bathyarchaeia archaeon]